MDRDRWKKLYDILLQVYLPEEAEFVLKEAKKLQKSLSLSAQFSSLKEKFNQKDAALIIYANSIIDATGKKKPLEMLAEFIEQFQLRDLLTVVHILPFYPWDTDRGFSVEDYYQVHPEYGSWEDIKKLAKKTRLMFDFVLNHASVDNPLVQNALIERHINPDSPDYKKFAEFKDFVIAFSEKDKPSEDILSKLARPRPNPVLTPYVVFQEKGGKYRAILGEKKDVPSGVRILGSGWVWTTFSRPKTEDGKEDTRQVDLNYANPKVLVEALKIMIFYIKQGASFLRLDAVAYMWKELGTSSLHHKNTHLLLRFMREFLNIVAPDVVFIAEVNERFDKVIEYLGDKQDLESDIVYQFTNFVLAVYSLVYSNPSLYAKWYKSTKKVDGRQFTVVLGSHDGMGVKPLRGLLPDDAIEEFTQRMVEEYKALPNYAYLSGGKKIIYELCSTPWNLINKPGIEGEAALRRYLLIFSLGLMVKGLPAIYINGLVGSKNYFPEEGLDENRTVNREVLDFQSLSERLNSDDIQAQVFSEIKKILKARQQLKFLSPWNYFPEVNVKDKLLIFSFSQKDKDEFIALYNFSSNPISFKLSGRYEDVLNASLIDSTVQLPGFGFSWLLKK